MCVYGGGACTITSQIAHSARVAAGPDVSAHSLLECFVGGGGAERERRGGGTEGGDRQGERCRRERGAERGGVTERRRGEGRERENPR